MSEPEYPAPLEFPYPIFEPRTSIRLHDGVLEGEADASHNIQIELSYGDSTALHWESNLDIFPFSLDPAKKVVTILRNNHEVTFEVQARTTDNGWINEVEVGHGLELKRVLVAWMNLPYGMGNASLESSYGWWRGRWSATLSDWIVTADERADHMKTFADFRTRNIFAFSHVMEISRANGERFTVDQVKRLIEGLRIGFSFAFGGWVAPVLPVGYDEHGEIAWENWHKPICAPANPNGHGWLYPASTPDVIEFARCVVAAAEGPYWETTRFQLIAATEGNMARFIEYRLLNGFPALASLAWIELKKKRVLSNSVFDALGERSRLRELLKRASIKTEIDSESMPNLEKYAEGLKVNDGPEALSHLRNKLIHPKEPHKLYAQPGLTLDGWYLTRYYLTLLILHSLGYTGKTQQLVPPFGRANAIESVPWVGSEPEPAPTPTDQLGDDCTPQSQP